MIRWAVAALSIGVATIGLYAPVWDHAFVEFDDPLYVTSNANVQLGLTLGNLRWALASGDAFIWHPLTWISYLVDASLYGTDHAGPWLLTNVVLHAVNALLVFGVLHAITAGVAGPTRTWACGLAAALFAVHPIQVESVAWVSSRKELLAGTFLLLTVQAYARYVRRPGVGRYAWVLVATALGFTAKGSHVALPFALLLLDYWPLRRLQAGADFWPRLRGLAIEKLPLLALSLASVVVNFAFVSRAENPWGTDPDLPTRSAAAIVNLAGYVGRLVWPTGLAVVYPNALQAGAPPASLVQVLAAVLALVAVTLMAARAGQRRGHWLVGWLWFLALLLPMTGLIPMGLRTPHDRYAYVPFIGLALAAGFGLSEAASGGRGRRIGVAGAAVVLLLVLSVATHRQIAVWKDSFTLFDHALRVTEGNAIVHYAKGTALARRGDLDAARAELEAALEIQPRHASSNNNLGYMLVQRGEMELGIAHLKRALEVRPDWTRARINLGQAQLGQGALDEAIATFERAAEGSPNDASVRAALGVALLRAGRRAEAAAAFRAALRLDPDEPTSRQALGSGSAAAGRAAP